MVPTLEEEIEQLSNPQPRSQLESQAPLQKLEFATDRDPGDGRAGATRVGQRMAMLPTLSITLPRWVQNLKEMRGPKDFKLEDLLEMGLEVDCFLWGLFKSSDEENMKTPPLNL